MEYRCDKCNIRIHPVFLGHHKCGYGNCPVCKDPISNEQYWIHIRSHPGHENDAPPPPRRTSGNWERRSAYPAQHANDNTKR